MKILSSKIPKLMLTMGIVAVFSSSKLMAKPIDHVFVDVYGTKKISAAEIKDRFGKDIVSISNFAFKKENFMKDNTSKEIKALQTNLKNSINAMGDFSYLHISSMGFPGTKNTYFTIDVVDKEDTGRVPHFLPEPVNTISDPDNLIASWEEYQTTGTALYFRKKIATIQIPSCPAFVCTMPQDEPELKKYKGIFETLVPKDKNTLVAILREDHDPDKRANAASLLAYIKDGNELIKILTPALRDSNMQVRSNAMQVLGGVIYTLKTADFPVQKVIDAADRPDLEERNKALFLLNALAMRPANVKYIKQHAKDLLLTELKQEQPYVHDRAYQILQQISGQKFGERDYTAWEFWLNTNKSA